MSPVRRRRSISISSSAAFLHPRVPPCPSTGKEIHTSLPSGREAWAVGLRDLVPFSLSLSFLIPPAFLSFSFTCVRLARSLPPLPPCLPDPKNPRAWLGGYSQNVRPSKREISWHLILSPFQPLPPLLVVLCACFLLLPCRRRLFFSLVCSHLKIS